MQGQTERQMDRRMGTLETVRRQAGNWADRQRDRQKERQMDAQVGRQKMVGEVDGPAGRGQREKQADGRSVLQGWWYRGRHSDSNASGRGRGPGRRQ